MGLDWTWGVYIQKGQGDVLVQACLDRQKGYKHGQRLRQRSGTVQVRFVQYKDKTQKQISITTVTVLPRMPSSYSTASTSKFPDLDCLLASRLLAHARHFTRNQ